MSWKRTADRNPNFTSARAFALVFFSLTCLCPGIAGAQAKDSKLRATLTVYGHGENRVKPDLALLDVAVETTGPTAQEAARLNAQLSQKVIVALKDQVGNDGSVGTGSYNLFPEYAPKAEGGATKLIGYRVENSVTVRTSALQKIGHLIDAAIAAGANRVNRLSFTIRDDTAARNAAIALAGKDAESKAQALASALGVKLKRVVSASIEGPVQRVPLAMTSSSAFGASGNVPTPVELGLIAVPATVSVVYEIE